MTKFVSKENFKTIWQDRLQPAIDKKEDALPSGTPGQVLTKAENGVEWKDITVPPTKPYEITIHWDRNDKFTVSKNFNETIANAVEQRKDIYIIFTYTISNTHRIYRAKALEFDYLYNEDTERDCTLKIFIDNPNSYEGERFIVRLGLTHDGEYASSDSPVTVTLTREPIKELPTTGESGQVLVKTDTGTEWRTVTTSGESCDCEDLTEEELEEIFKSGGPVKVTVTTTKGTGTIELANIPEVQNLIETAFPLDTTARWSSLGGCSVTVGILDYQADQVMGEPYDIVLQLPLTGNPATQASNLWFNNMKQSFSGGIVIGNWESIKDILYTSGNFGTAGNIKIAKV